MIAAAQELISTNHSLCKHKIMIVDDHPIVRQGLSTLIDKEADLEICGGAGTVESALEQVEQRRPDLVIVDICLHDGNGIDLITQLRARHPRIKTLVWSMFDEMIYAERALRAGAMGYINKQQPIQVVLEAVRHVLKGEIFLSPRMTTMLAQRVSSGRRPEDDPTVILSNRELQVYHMIGQGKTTQEIAAALHLSVKTIETHRERIKMKLGLRNAAELSRSAVVWALEHG